MRLTNKLKAAFKAALLFTTLFFFNNSLYAEFTYEGDSLIGEKALKKLDEMGNELYQKTGVSTVIVAKSHLTKEEFLEVKNRYLKTLKNPYVLWIFSKSYMDRTNVGINQMFSSADVKDKFDEDSLFSPWGGTFTKVLTVHKSKSDPTAAAFLNGYGDLTDMIAESYGIKLDSSIGNETKTTINVARILFYVVTLFFFIYYIKVKYFNKEKK
ncbi:MAG: hypothetical protein K0U47_07035 [Epsilonproteobacteria bacterium]|nr:hypothetical protein [Campylobacterota bacterium]